MTIVSFRIRANEPSPGKMGQLTTALPPVVNNSFPLGVEWDSSVKITYRVDSKGIVRYKRN